MSTIAPVSNFEHILPEIIFDAVETLGGRCTGRFLGLNAMENRVYEVELEGGKKVVIKFYRPGRWDRPTIQAEHDFLFRLLENEIPVVPPIQNASKQSLFETQGVFYAVFEKRPGRLEPELNPDQLKRLGRFLGRLHNVGASFPHTSRVHLNPKTYGLDSLQALLSLGFLVDSVRPKYEYLVHEICKNIEPLFQNVATVLLHGDCHCGNVLWKGDEPYFIDFDDMVYAPPVQDIWMLTGGDDEDGKERRKVLVQSYETMRPFDPTTLALIEPLRTLRMIYFNTWIGRRWEDGAFKRTFPDFGSERYWQSQIEGLSLQLEKIREPRDYGY